MQFSSASTLTILGRTNLITFCKFLVYLFLRKSHRECVFIAGVSQPFKLSSKATRSDILKKQ